MKMFANFTTEVEGVGGLDAKASAFGWASERGRRLRFSDFGNYTIESKNFVTRR